MGPREGELPNFRRNRVLRSFYAIQDARLRVGVFKGFRVWGFGSSEPFFPGFFFMKGSGWA